MCRQAWLATTTVMFSSSTRPMNSDMIFSAANGSTEAVGSSAMTMDGLCARARPMATRWRSPVDSLPGSLSRCRAMPSSRASSVDRVVLRQAEYGARQRHVVAHRQIGQQAAGLHHVADVPLAQIAEPVLLPFVPVPGDVDRLVHPLRAKAEGGDLARLEDEGQHVEQGRFAATGLADQGDLLALGDLQAGYRQSEADALGLALLGDVAQMIDQLWGRLAVGRLGHRRAHGSCSRAIG